MCLPEALGHQRKVGWREVAWAPSAEKLPRGLHATPRPRAPGPALNGEKAGRQRGGLAPLSCFHRSLRELLELTKKKGKKWGLQRACGMCSFWASPGSRGDSCRGGGPAAHLP